MKSLLISLVLGAASFASAATISVTNFEAPSTFHAILGAGGLAPTSGIVTLGTYTSEPSSAESVLNGYTSLGSLAFGATPGFISGDINVDLPLGSPAVGQQVYVVIGNGTTLQNSTQFLVWKPTSNPAGNTFTADNPVGGPDLLGLFGDKGTTIVGEFGIVADAGVGSQGNFRLAQVVPEPSAMLLGAFGALGLLRRRR